VATPVCAAADPALTAVAAGQSCRSVAATFGVSVSSVVKWSQRARMTGSAAAKPMGGRRPYRLAAERDWLLGRIAWKTMTFLAALRHDLNPIEQVFAKLKTLLRKAEERTVEATWKRIGKLLDHFHPNECANYIKNAGYASI
ncbi:MAG: hypothetical protein ACE5EM_11560, partial [Sphingomonadales bacterium]